jgi:hypothetical protein
MELSTIQSKIYEIRGVKVMLDFDLAELVANCDKLPENMKDNPATPFAFTEEGVEPMNWQLGKNLRPDVVCNGLKNVGSVIFYCVCIVVVSQMYIFAT